MTLTWVMEVGMRLLLAVALTAMNAGHASAQDPGNELRRILETIETMDDAALSTPYMSARCGGLYDGVLGYGGGSLPEELRNQYDEAANIFVFASAVMRVENARASGRGSTDLDANIKQAFLESERFEAIYIERFRTNSDFRGSMLAGDDLAKDDIAFCQEAFPLLEAVASKALGRDALSQ